jgi:hypothetical protein
MLLRRSLSGIHASTSTSTATTRAVALGTASRATRRSSGGGGANANANADAPKPKPKPKRDYTNPVVVESIRRKKAAKGIVDDRLPVPEICPTCARRFCRCAKPNGAAAAAALARPREPLETDCCRSDPRCKFCVFKVYEELLEEYEAAVRDRDRDDG